MPLTLVGVKFAVHPSPKQATSLRQWIGCQRVIYNARVEEDNYFRTFKRKSLSLVDQKVPLDQQYSQFKNEELTPWLSDVPSQEASPL